MWTGAVAFTFCALLPAQGDEAPPIRSLGDAGKPSPAMEEFWRLEARAAPALFRLLPFLARRLQDEDEGIRSLALSVFKGIRNLPTALVPLIARRLTDPSRKLRAEAVETLMEARGDLGPALLREIRKAGEDGVRVRLALIHARRQSRFPVPPEALLLGLGDELPRVRWLAAGACARQGRAPPEALPLLRELCRAPQPELRIAAILALPAFAKAPAHKPAAGWEEEAAVPWLLHRLQEVQRAGTPEGSYEFLALLDAAKAFGRKGLPVLTKGLGSPRPEVRQSALRALQELGPEAREALPALLALRARAPPLSPIPSSAGSSPPWSPGRTPGGPGGSPPFFEKPFKGNPGRSSMPFSGWSPGSGNSPISRFPCSRRDFPRPPRPPGSSRRRPKSSPWQDPTRRRPLPSSGRIWRGRRNPSSSPRS